jgi:hypothetical protein
MFFATCEGLSSFFAAGDRLILSQHIWTGIHKNDLESVFASRPFALCVAGVERSTSHAALSKWRIATSHTFSAQTDAHKHTVRT